MSSTNDLVAMRLKGKVAIITGGASGFGETTAKLFVKHGAKVIIADVQDTKGLSLCQEITATATATGEISYVHCNVTDDTDVKNLIDTTIFKHGKLDIMFNNAGISGDVDPTILGSTNENFLKVFNINVYGGYLGAKHAARVMIPQKSGVILFTGSIASVLGGESPHAYTMSKHAILGLMKSLCVEMGQYGVRVNAISPCGVSTPLLQNGMGMIDKGVIDGLLCESAVLKGVTPEAEDVANAALYLASDEAKFVNGLNLMVDGGYSVTNPSFSMAVHRLFAST
ncbi:short chain aldehyde dehydrogenase 1-like [Silene latifolia]|uniref:short chain aldehyde dehydrogenase 1-like n=1 Tax=Silene latifolia TaxID=37657 RepID=UPI003D7746F9